MSSSSFIAPIFRQFCIWIGGIPVTKGTLLLHYILLPLISPHFLSPLHLIICTEAARSATSHGHSLSLVPGGIAEMILADPRYLRRGAGTGVWGDDGDWINYNFRPRLLEKAELETAIFSGETQSNTVSGASETKEMMNSRPRKTVVLYLQKRKGFIKLALELGLDLVPVFTFGELENYHQVRWGLSWRMKMSRMLKLPLIFVYGKYPFPSCFSSLLPLPPLPSLLIWMIFYDIYVWTSSILRTYGSHLRNTNSSRARQGAITSRDRLLPFCIFFLPPFFLPPFFTLSLSLLLLLLLSFSSLIWTEIPGISKCYFRGE